MGKTTSNITIVKTSANAWVEVGTQGLDTTIENASEQAVYFALGDSEPSTDIQGHELASLWSPTEPTQREAFSSGDRLWIMNPRRDADAKIIISE